MKSNTLDKVVEDLFSVPPLIIRGIRRKLLKTAFANIDVDISPLHFEIMKLLNEAGTLHIAEIGERLHIARPQMTHLIDKLVDLGITERQTDTTDRRMIICRQLFLNALQQALSLVITLAIKGVEKFYPIDPARSDLIQILFHTGGELQPHVGCEVLPQ